MDEKETIEWQSLEYAHRDHTNDWFWWLGVIALAGIIASLFSGNVLLAVLILVAGFTIALHAVRKPRMLSYKLSSRGIEIGDEKHLYKNLKSFWISKKENGAMLLLQSEKILSPHIAIEIPGEEEARIKSRLMEHIPEEEHEEPISHILIEFFKF